MKRINYLIQKLVGAAIPVASLAFVAGFFGMPGNGHAQVLCQGGSAIYDSTHTLVGCAFSNWGPAEQSMCSGATVFGPANSGTCHICVKPPIDQKVAKDDYSGLTLQPAPGSGPDAPTTFGCLKCTQPPPSMSAWWTLDEPSGLSVTDFTGNMPAGYRYNGAAIVPGQVGNATKFDGINDYIEIPNASPVDVGPAAVDGSGDFAIDAWVKIDPGTDASGVRVIVEKRTYSSNQYKGYSFYLYNRYLGFQLADGGYANYGAPALVVPQDGQWHFVAATVARAGTFSVQFTLDNQPMVVVNGPARNGSLANPSPLRIGMVTIGNGSVFNGSIDEVEFFRRAVTYNEWQTIFNAKCYGKCRVQPWQDKKGGSPLGFCTWDPIRQIWTNCTN